MYLRRRDGGDYNVTLTKHGDVDWERELLFRDFLRAHPEAARRYEQVKLHAAEMHERHTAYAGEKRALIQQLQEQASSWRRAVQDAESSLLGMEPARG